MFGSQGFFLAHPFLAQNSPKFPNMRASSWLFANSLSQKNYPTQEMIIWDISGGAHHSKRDNGAPMIGKRCFKGQIALGSKHVKGYFIGGLFA